MQKIDEGVNFTINEYPELVQEGLEAYMGSSILKILNSNTNNTKRIRKMTLRRKGGSLSQKYFSKKIGILKKFMKDEIENKDTIKSVDNWVYEVDMDKENEKIISFGFCPLYQKIDFCDHKNIPMIVEHRMSAGKDEPCADVEVKISSSNQNEKNFFKEDVEKRLDFLDKDNFFLKNSFGGKELENDIMVEENELDLSFGSGSLDTNKDSKVFEKEAPARRLSTLEEKFDEESTVKEDSPKKVEILRKSRSHFNIKEIAIHEDDKENIDTNTTQRTLENDRIEIKIDSNSARRAIGIDFEKSSLSEISSVTKTFMDKSFNGFNLDQTYLKMVEEDKSYLDRYQTRKSLKKRVNLIDREMKEQMEIAKMRRKSSRSKGSSNSPVKVSKKRRSGNRSSRSKLEKYLLRLERSSKSGSSKSTRGLKTSSRARGKSSRKSNSKRKKFNILNKKKRKKRKAKSYKKPHKKTVKVNLTELPYGLDKYKVDMRKKKSKKTRKVRTAKRSRKPRTSDEVPTINFNKLNEYFLCSKSKIKDRSEEIHSSDVDFSIFKLEENYDFFKKYRYSSIKKNPNKNSFEKELQKMRNQRMKRSSLKKKENRESKSYYSLKNLHKYSNSLGASHQITANTEKNSLKPDLKKQTCIDNSEFINSLCYESVECDKEKVDWRNKVKESMKKFKFNI